MLTHQAINQYRQNHIQHASPVEIVAMLYDKAIHHLNIASEGIVEKDVDTKCLALSRVIDIVTELQVVLDKDRGGEIAKRLDALYTYMLERLTMAHYHNDVQQMEEIIGLLQELRDAWRTLAQPACREPQGRRTMVTPAGAAGGLPHRESPKTPDVWAACARAWRAGTAASLRARGLSPTPHRWPGTVSSAPRFIRLVSPGFRSLLRKRCPAPATR